MITILSALIFAIVASLAVTLALLFALRQPVQSAQPDHEAQRRMHTGAIPSFGGLIIWATVLPLALVVLSLPASLNALLLAVTLAVGISSLDDAIGLPARWRLPIHFAIAALAISAISLAAQSGFLIAQQVFSGLLPPLVVLPLLLVALVWFINLFNFMDGIDGFAGVEAISILLGYALLCALDPASANAATRPFIGLALTLTGALFGFLFWNWHPARVFLGDAGAIPLGVFCGALLIDLALRQSIAAALILPMYFLADATVTLLRR
ncbi:MAG: glycosyl transferase, partial [Pseudomonadota bacterium]